MKQTSVEWLKTELGYYGDPDRCIISWEELDSLLQQAMYMETMQRESEFVDGYKAKAEDSNHIFDEVSEMYAKLLFNKKLKI